MKYGETDIDYHRIGLTTSKKVPSVCLRGNEYPISDILEASSRPFRNVRRVI